VDAIFGCVHGKSSKVPKSTSKAPFPWTYALLHILRVTPYSRYALRSGVARVVVLWLWFFFLLLSSLPMYDGITYRENDFHRVWSQKLLRFSAYKNYFPLNQLAMRMLASSYMLENSNRTIELAMTF